MSVASGRLTVLKASGTRRAPSIRWKAPAAPLPAESHCATVRCSYPILGAENPTLRSAARVLPPPWPGCSTLFKAARVLCSHLTAAPIWSNHRNRGTVYAFDRGRAPDKLGSSSSGTAMNRQTNMPTSFRQSVAMISDSCSRSRHSPEVLFF